MPTSFAIPVADPALEAELGAKLRRVEEHLQAAVRSEDTFVATASRHLVDAGGKRFRPLLTLLAAQFGDPDAVGVVPAAVVVELTHLATLYHDDVMDEAAVRRGAPSANARWGNSLAILTGDYLFAQASEILADLGPEAVRIQARTYARLVTGQIRETVGPKEGADPLDHYLSVVADKTGSLIATSARLGAMLAGADEATVSILTEYGERIGVAFQLSDDILDITAQATGKEQGTDLREGVPTLPGLHVLRSTDPADARLQDLLRRPLTDEAEVAEALSSLRKHPGMAAAHADLRHYADEARDLLTPLPQGAARAALEAVCRVVVDRSF